MHSYSKFAMASSSACPSAPSFSSTPSWKYDVFLSFRGDDTRRHFTDHLYTELKRFGINTFIDDQLRRGEQISPALLQAIEDSKFSIIIFSQNYASSSWCLDELSKILECVQKGKHTTFPVFYEVDPSDVRNQRGSYAEAFKKHEEAYKNNMEKVVKWRGALTEASGYSGWDTRDRYQSEIIKEIVFKIFNKVPGNPSSNDKIGMEFRIKAVLSLLCIGSHDVRMVGIWGMGGIGKTTIAKAIYDTIRTQFQGSCFLSNVREKSQRIEKLQMELLSKILGEENLDDRIFNSGINSIKKVLHSKKVLIVLDDVNDIEQLEELVGHRDWFVPESRIIITTRDKRLLTEKDVDAIYEPKELERGEALMLFRQHAFKDKPLEKDFEELCYRFLEYTKGNPLAIKILGSLLYKRTKKEWDCELKKLKELTNKDIQKVLSISFDGLEDNVKDIFLDIACFFKGKDKDYVSELLESCDLYPEIGIHTLVERALITISYDNKLCMHDLIQEMGWNIVRQQSSKDQRSRLWLNEDIDDVLTANIGTEKMQGIVLDLSTLEELVFNVDVFTKMTKLRVLEFRVMDGYYFRGKPIPSKMQLTGKFEFLSKNLRYLRWEGYPLKSLPSKFNPRKLFELNMRFSQLKQLWEGNKPFQNLRYMDLSHSRYLNKTPNLSGAPELRRINLECCTSLVEVHPSIETLTKLSFLDLTYCSKLKELAKSFCQLTSLERMNFFGCSKLRKLPDDLRVSSPNLYLCGCSKLEELPKSIGELTSLKTLDLTNCSGLKRLPDNIGNIGTSLVTLKLSGCSKLEELPKSIGKLMSLETLKLFGCAKLMKLPNDIGRLQCLKKLLADGSGIREVPPTIIFLTRLEVLSLAGCKGSGEHCSSSNNLALSLSSWLPRQGLRLPFFLGLRSLLELNLRDCNLQEGVLPSDMSSLCSLKHLDLSKNCFITLPSLIPLTQLDTLKVESCKSLQSLTELPSGIETVLANNCESLETFLHPPESYAKAKFEVHFDFSNCRRLVENEENVNLEALLRGIRIVSSAIWEERSFDALVPGSNIPEWFTHWNVGNSIVVQLRPPDVHDFEFKSVGLGFCAVLGKDHSRWHSDHLWFGFESDEYYLFEPPVSHVKFSFVGNDGETPLVIKKCAIHLLHEPDEECYTEEIIEYDTVNATIVSPPPTLRDEEPWSKTTIDAQFGGDMYYETSTKKTYRDECPVEVRTLRLHIKVEGYNIYVPEHIMTTSLMQDPNKSETERVSLTRKRKHMMTSFVWDPIGSLQFSTAPPIRRFHLPR